MKLLLTAQSTRNKSIESALRKMLSKPSKDCVAVYITTAQNSAVGDKSWFIGNLNDAFNLGWKSFEIIDLAAMINLPKEMWWDRITAADVIFVGGGDTHYLSYWFEKSGLSKALPELLKTRIYVGASAGSIVVTKSAIGGSGALQQLASGGQVDMDILGPENQRSPKTLQLVDVVFRPHYQSANYSFITDELLQKAANFSGCRVYALDDDCALKVIDTAIEVISEGQWKQFDPS